MPKKTVKNAIAVSTVVEIDKVTYDLAKIPAKDTPLVLQERERVLGTLNLDDLVANLDLTSELLWVAYNGVASSGSLRGQVHGLEIELAAIGGDCELALNSFERNIERVLENLIDVFGYLLKGKENYAIDTLSDCATYAKDMSERATALVNRFDKLLAMTTNTLKETHLEKGKTEAQQRAYAEQLSRLEAKTAKAKKLASQLADEKTKLEKMYQEAKEAAASAADRAFALSMVSAIFTPISQGVATFGAIYASRGMPPSINLPETPAPAPASPPPAASAPTAGGGKASTPAPADSDDEEDDDDSNPHKAGNAGAAGKDGGVVLDLGTGEVTKGDKPAPPAGSKSAGTKPASTNAPLNQPPVAPPKPSDDAATSASGYQKIVQDLSKEKMKYLDLLMDSQKQEREALASIEEFAVLMKGLSGAKALDEVIVQALHQAVGALGSIVVILQTASQFWKQMASACERLADSGLKKKIEMFKGDSLKERLDQYNEPAFKAKMLQLLAQWCALGLVSHQYAEATKKTKEKTHGYLKRNPTTEESLKDAPALGAKLQLATDNLKKENESKTEVLQLTADNLKKENESNTAVLEGAAAAAGAPA
jgi:hypothetical protein